MSLFDNSYCEYVVCAIFSILAIVFCVMSLSSLNSFILVFTIFFTSFFILTFFQKDIDF